MDNSSQNIRMNICYGCMKPLEDGQFICQSCGHNNSQRNNPEDALPEGSILNGKYLVGKVLGRGGFGVTYLGFELNLQIRVAIKEFFPMGMSSRSSQNYSVISSATAENEAFSKGCAAFLDEARTLAVINSSYVVHVRDYFKEHSTAYLIMDYVDGKTLAREMKESGGRIPSERLFSLINPMILEIEKLHKKNIIHRDIAPDNLIIVRDELTDEEHLVLLDFGAARSFVSSQISQRYTATVKAGFAPLEQYSQKSKQGPYTDVYALCATIYYTLTGTIPPSALERSADGAEIKPLGSFGIQLPEYVEQAIMHGLVQSSESRTQTMQQLYEELTTPPDERQLRYNAALKMMDEAATKEDFYQAEKALAEIGDYKNALKLSMECREKAEECRKRTLYAEAKELMAKEALSAYRDAAKKLEDIGNWQDAAQQLDYCRLKIKELSGGNKPKVKILPIALSALIAAGALAFALFRKPVTVTDDSRVEELEQQLDSLTAERDNAVKKASEAEEAKQAAESALTTANEALSLAQSDAEQAKAEAERLKTEQAKAVEDAKAKEEEAVKANAEAAEAKRLAEEAKLAAEEAERKSVEAAGASAKEMEEALKEAKAAAEAAEKRAAEAEAKAEAKADEASKAKEQAETATKSAESAKAEADAAGQRAAEALEAKDVAEQRAAEAVEAKNAAEQRAEEATEAKEAAEQRADEATKELEEKEQQQIQENYSKAVALFNDGSYETAKAAFEELGDYLDSQEYVTYCEAAISRAESERIKNQIPVITAIELDDNNYPTVKWQPVENAKIYIVYRSVDQKSYTNIVNTEDTEYTFKSCKGGEEYFFKVKAELEDSSSTKFSDAVSIKIPKRMQDDYEKAVALFNEGSYEKAKTAFEELGDYLDSQEYVTKCEAAISRAESERKRNQIPVITAIELNGDNNPVITWEEMESVDYYTIYRSEDNNAYTNLNINTKQTSYILKSCKEGREYFFKIKAKLKDGTYTEFSEVEGIWIPEGATAVIPVIETIELDEYNNPVISWSTVDNADFYSVYISEDGKNFYIWEMNVKKNTFTVKSCDEGQEYYFRIRAKLSGGAYTEFSEEKSILIPQSSSTEKTKLSIDDTNELYANALVLLESGQYQAAEGIFESLGDYGDSQAKLAEARYHIGVSYETGDGITKNERLALSYYQLAADDGNADAMNKLGECAYYGIGREKNYDEAFTLFEQASDSGSSDALYNLGLCYENGTGIVKDARIAYSYFQLAADSGNGNAINKLGECAYYGIGRNQDYEEAFKLFERASDLGCPDAYYNLGLCYENGRGIEKNEKTAKAYYMLAADGGNEAAQAKIGG